MNEKDYDDYCEYVPENPVDGQRFICPGCDYSVTFVVLDDEPGEWV